MAQFMIEIAQGCCTTWTKSCKPIKISDLRSLVRQSPQSFMGDIDRVELRLEVGGAVLPEDFQVVKTSKIFAKKPAKSTGSSSAAASSSKKAPAKKDKKGAAKDDEVQVDFPTTVSGPSKLILNGCTVNLVFQTADAATEFATFTCTETGIDLKKAISDREKTMKKLEAEKLRARLAELEEDASDTDASEVEVEYKPPPRAPTDKKEQLSALQQQALARGIYLDSDKTVGEQGSDDDVVAAVNAALPLAFAGAAQHSDGDEDVVPVAVKNKAVGNKQGKKHGKK